MNDNIIESVNNLTQIKNFEFKQSIMKLLGNNSKTIISLIYLLGEF